MPAAANIDPKVQQQLVLIQTLAAQGIPFDKITGILALMGNQGAAAPAAPAPSVPPLQQQQQRQQSQMPQPTSSYSGPAPWEAPRQDEPRDRNRYRDAGLRSPRAEAGRGHGRRRAGGTRRTRRRTATAATDASRRSTCRRRRRRRARRARRRLPPAIPHARDGAAAARRRRSGFTPEPAEAENAAPQDKWIDYDPSLPSGCIQVLSRTLFVGGVTCSSPSCARSSAATAGCGRASSTRTSATPLSRCTAAATPSAPRRPWRRAGTSTCRSGYVWRPFHTFPVSLETAHTTRHGRARQDPQT